MKLSGRATLVFVSLALSVTASDSIRAHVRITTDINWGADVRPILRKHCMGCHSPGGIAPDYVDLTTYGTDRAPGARAWATAIEEEILTGRMPPWLADPRFGSFRNGRRLTQEEIDTVVAWVQGGGPQGPRRDLPPPEEYSGPGWVLGEPDLVVEPAQDFVLAAGESTGEVSFQIPLGIEEDAWVTGFEFLPGRPDTVHRIVALVHDPAGLEPQTLEIEVKKEYDPFAEEDEREEVRQRPMPQGPHFLGQWVRGDAPVLLPDEAGRLLRRGSTVELQVTYRRSELADPGEAVRDRSRLGLFLSPEDVDRLVESRQVPVAAGRVKAGRTQTLETSLLLQEDVHLVGFNPHLGDACQSLEVRAVYPDGRASTLLWISQYDPKWASSFVFEEPVAAPVGTRVEMTGVFRNSAKKGGPALKIGGRDSDAPFVAFVDYMLDSHLQVTEPPPERRPEPTNRGSGMVLGDLVGDPLGAKGGAAEEVEDFLSGLQRKDDSFFVGKKVAPQSKEWRLSPDGLGEVYWCPNRGRQDHTLEDHAAPGRCPICEERLLHRSRFEFTPVYRCITQECPLQQKGQEFYGEGLCPYCGEPVQSLGHMDHTPLHGSDQFFMSDNLYHHLEGTLPAEGEFRLYVYDDWKRPVDPRNFAAKVIFEDYDEKTGEYTEEELPMGYPAPGEEYLVGSIRKGLPAEFYARVWLAGEEKRFDFYFEELTVEPPPGISALGNVRLHSHERVPPEIPARAVDVVREILARQAVLAALIDAEEWFALHNPAFDAKDLAEELGNKLETLGVRERGRAKRAISQLLLAALDLDRAGDAEDEPRVKRSFQRLQDATGALLDVFPQAEASAN